MIVFIIVIGAFIYTIASAVARFFHNQRSPEIVVMAKVIGKRTQVHSYRGGSFSQGAHHHHSGFNTETRYFVTFETEDFQREEFQVTGKDYGLIKEGDSGRLFYRGTRFLGFERTN